MANESRNAKGGNTTMTRKVLSLGELMAWVQAQRRCPICQEEECDCWQALAAAPALLEALRAEVSVFNNVPRGQSQASLALTRAAIAAVEVRRHEHH